MAYDRGKIQETYINPNWGNFTCMRGLRIMGKLSDAYDLMSQATLIADPDTWEYSLAEMPPECKQYLLDALQIMIDDLTTLT